MRDSLGSLVDVVERLIDAFEQTQIPYALGGAIAYSAWAEPRATRDIDLNIWLDMENFELAFRLLEACGVTLNRAAARQAAHERGMFVARHGEYRIDVRWLACLAKMRIESPVGIAWFASTDGSARSA